LDSIPCFKKLKKVIYLKKECQFADKKMTVEGKNQKLQG